MEPNGYELKDLTTGDLQLIGEESNGNVFQVHYHFSHGILSVTNDEDILADIMDPNYKPTQKLLQQFKEKYGAHSNEELEKKLEER